MPSFFGRRKRNSLIHSRKTSVLRFERHGHRKTMQVRSHAHTNNISTNKHQKTIPRPKNKNIQRKTIFILFLAIGRKSRLVTLHIGLLCFFLNNKIRIFYALVLVVDILSLNFAVIPFEICPNVLLFSMFHKKMYNIFKSCHQKMCC